MKIVLIILAGVLVLVVAVGIWAWTPDRPRAALEAKYLRAPVDLIQVAGAMLHVRDDGPRGAPAVIMIHGFGSSLHTWEAWAVDLSRDHRVMRFDLPGAGLSPPDATGDYTDARVAALLLALMDRLAIPRATLVGNSIGGRIAWGFAAAHPDRVDTLVLVSPDGFASPGFAYGATPQVPVALGLMRYALPRALLKMNLDPSYGNATRLTSATVDRYHDLLLGPGTRDALLARLRQTVLTDPVPRLRTIRAPVLLVWGEKDRLIPVANARDYTAALSDSRLVTFPDLGHVPMEEDPARSLVPVRAFLAAAR